jgi:serine O-acetyltransferase
LQEQVRKSVRIGDPKTPTGKTVPIMKKFVRAIPALRELLKHDLEATAIQQLAHRL